MDDMTRGTVAIVVVIAGKCALSIFGATFVNGYSVLLVLTVGFLTRAVTGPLGAYPSVSGNQDDVLYASTATATSNVVFNVLLIPLFGITGLRSHRCRLLYLRSPGFTGWSGGASESTDTFWTENN